MISLTPSHIIEYLFCPRFTYFEYVLGIPQYEEKHFKVIKGRKVHDLKLERNKEYLRKKIGVKEKWVDQYLTNESLRGKIDEVLLLDDNTMAPLDYKFAEYKDRIFETYKQQLICYALLIEKNFGREVNRGYLVYVRSKNKLLEVQISDSDKQMIKETIEKISWIMEQNHYPKATKYKRRCLNCTYRNICTQ
ncbi:CRISPR-associated protein Cas4 [Cecembia lonarensis]|uniref:CRISPR-associated exonuclease Cas4 n=1 Tax=Cecembia lonarensis (strain CCUG 58316 / KCTC 22772 / LW9) TaxID=1225176 RepID=K1LUN0_CECL9|nr:CRISPR-associated protein Cas4 [Cecembia lonarensis]EKB47824.1 CRISPR-associated protein Cas4 [Cecembia lonarensis LW9]